MNSVVVGVDVGGTKVLGERPTVLEEKCSGNPAALSGPMVTEAAEDGDLLAREAFHHVGDWLGDGLANLVAAFDTEVVVVGGGVSAAGERLLEPARLALTRSLVGAGHRQVPALVSARLGPEAGLVGAAELMREWLFSRGGTPAPARPRAARGRGRRR